MRLMINRCLLFYVLAVSTALCSCSNSGSKTSATGQAAKPTVTTTATKKVSTTAVRKFTEIDARTYKVEVIISKVSEPKSFRKLVENLPEEYTVSDESLKDIAAHFKPGELKYVWVDNYQPDFSVTYLLKIPKGKKLVRDYEGYFAYIENDEKVSIPIYSEK
ncbi:MAG: hypothetical protein JWO09_2907 [Bacteroidetes bacterium]|nr:hypothetical protein [Bacteroidota bacterium]